MNQISIVTKSENRNNNETTARNIIRRNRSPEINSNG